MTSPEVSVIMGVRNAVRFVERAVESILGQGGCRLELIAVDDASEDGSSEVLRRIAAHEGRLVLTRNPSSGLAAALNHAADLARGEWIARMDADDVALPGRLRWQLEHARRHGIEVMGTDIRATGAALPLRRAYPRSHDAIRLQLLFNTPFAHPTVLLRRELLLRHRYDTTMNSAQDYDLWTRLAAAGARLGNLPAVLLRYRVHGQQTTMTGNRQQYRTALRSAQAYWKHLGALPSMSDTFSPDAVIEAIFDKWTQPSADLIHACVDTFVELRRQFGDPENVLSANAFRFALRVAASFGTPGHEPFPELGLNLGQRLTLQAIRATGMAWDRPLFQYLRHRAR